MSNEEPKGGKGEKWQKGRFKNFYKRSDLIPTSNISPINPPKRSVLCPVLDTLPDGIALGGRPAFPKKWYCVCEKCLPQAAQEYKSRMRDSVRSQMFHTAWNDPHIRYACDAAKRVCHRQYSPCRQSIPTEKLFFLPKFPDVGLTLCPMCLQMRNGTIYARFADFQSRARS